MNKKTALQALKELEEYIINLPDKEVAEWFARPNNLGTIKSLGPNNTVFLEDTFAPGIWAGTEQCQIKIGNRGYLILEVLFDERALRLNDTSYLKLGDHIEVFL